jgi:hypothetical protein
MLPATRPLQVIDFGSAEFVGPGQEVARAFGTIRYRWVAQGRLRALPGLNECLSAGQPQLDHPPAAAAAACRPPPPQLA